MSYDSYASQKDYEESQGLGHVMADALNDINAHFKHVKEYTQDCSNLHNVAEDGLPKKIVESEDWN